MLKIMNPDLLEPKWLSFQMKDYRWITLFLTDCKCLYGLSIFKFLSLAQLISPSPLPPPPPPIIPKAYQKLACLELYLRTSNLIRHGAFSIINSWESWGLGQFRPSLNSRLVSTMPQTWNFAQVHIFSLTSVVFETSSIYFR